MEVSKTIPVARTQVQDALNHLPGDQVTKKKTITNSVSEVSLKWSCLIRETKPSKEVSNTVCSSRSHSSTDGLKLSPGKDRCDQAEGFTGQRRHTRRFKQLFV